VPRAGARDDEQRTVAVRRGGELAGVQLLREVGGGHRPQDTASYAIRSERQVQPPSAFCSSEMSTGSVENPARSRSARVAGYAVGITSTLFTSSTDAPHGSGVGRRRTFRNAETAAPSGLARSVPRPA